MSDYLKDLKEKVRYAGMRKVASSIAALPPESRLLSRICITGNPGLAGRVCKQAGGAQAMLDYLKNN